jgi:pimeloyl-ACP methyl ester carboxylesterase
MKQLLPLTILSALAISAGAPSSFAQSSAASSSAPVYTKPLGIALEDIPYPYPTKFLELSNGGQKVRMAYMDIRPTRAFPGGGQPTVLLLHGKNFSGFYWGKPIRALSAAGYRVVVPDQIGFGKSSKPNLPYSFDLLTGNTAKLLDTLKVGQVSVVGHSMGGMVAVKFARRYPSRVQKLVLENPIGLEDYKAAIGPVPFSKLLQTELSDTNTTKIRAFYKRYFVQWKPEFEKFVAIKSRLALSGEFNRWATASALTYAPIFDEPIVPDFAKLKVPTLLIIGQSDRTVVGKPYARPEVAKTLGNYPRLGRRTQQAIPGAKLAEYTNVGHIPHLEAPDRFNASVLQFLK